MSSPQRKQRNSAGSCIINNNDSNNGGGGGGMRSGGGPAPFLVKTYRMVEDEGTSDVISWGDGGASFVVWKPVEFARDLLPVHFKHNNFSSFVRQLNTYGFRKVVPDRWEFGNDCFRRGGQVLIRRIRRRKATLNPSSAHKSTSNAAKNGATTAPPSTSASLVDIHSSSSTSSPPRNPPPQSQQILELTDENEKLKTDNQILNKELSQAKQQCRRLLSFLSSRVGTNDINASRLMEEAALAGVGIENVVGEAKNSIEVKEAVGVEDDGDNVACLKLFGVLLKGLKGADKNSSPSGSRKRGRCEEDGGGRRLAKVCFGGSPWMGMTSPGRESSKVCN